MKRWFASSLAVMLTAGALAGCSSGGKPADSAAGNGSSGTGTPSAQGTQDDMKDKLEINIVAMSYAGGGWPEHHPMIDYLDKKFNIDLKIQWVPSDTYSEKLNVLAASGSFPDAFMLGRPEFLKWRDKGIFLDVKPLLANYPNLLKYLGGDEALQFMNPKGKYYGFPYYTIENRDSLGIRKDWLDKLGLPMPKTTDDFLKTATAFATKDPDGDGKNDTYGFSASIDAANTEIQGIDPIIMAFGLMNGWGLKDGKLISWYSQTKELKEFASFMHEAYASGALDKDFTVNKGKDPQDKFIAGKVGVVMVVPTSTYELVVPPMQKLDPKAELAQLLPPKGPHGDQGTKTTATTQKIVINSKIDPKKQERILKLFDYFLSDEGTTLTKNGIEGVHYKKEGDKYVKLPAFDTDRPYLISTWLLRRYDPNIQIRLWDDQVKANKVSDWFRNNEPFRKPNGVAGLESATDTKLGRTIAPKLMATLVKVIMGELPVDAIDQAVEQWKKDGGDKITQEYNEAYQKLQ